MKNETEAASAWTIRIAMNHRGGDSRERGIQSSTGMLSPTVAVPIRRPLNRAEKEEEEKKTNLLSEFFCSFCFSTPFFSSPMIPATHESDAARWKTALTRFNTPASQTRRRSGEELQIPVSSSS